jgi:hypothetical protein
LLKVPDPSPVGSGSDVVVLLAGVGGVVGAGPGGGAGGGVEVDLPHPPISFLGQGRRFSMAVL